MENKKKLLLVVVVAGLIALSVFAVLTKLNIIQFSVNSGNNYQAIFLANGQVYFGKLSSQRGQWLVLRDIYYLQTTAAQTPLQPGQEPPSNINLVKLGGELHGPTDEMKINRDSILFIEDLKGDSNVLLAIEKLKSVK